MANIAYGEITILDLLDEATYIYYADSDSGSGASLSPDGKVYIGIYSGPALGTSQPDPQKEDDKANYDSIKSKITWAKYVGEDGEKGKDGNGIVSYEIRYQNGTSGIECPTGEWLDTPPSADESKPYLWTRTTLIYTEGEPSVSYSVSAHGQDGQDGDRFLIETSHERILKFKTNQGVEFSPVALGFSVYELTDKGPAPISFKEDASNDSRDASFKIQIQTDNSTFHDIPVAYTYQTKVESSEKAPTFFVLNFYNFLVEQTTISSASSEEESTSSAYADILKALESASTYIRFVYLENGVAKAYKPVEIANGVSEDMAEFNITATSINAAIQGRAMSFDATGLHILNGGFDISTEIYEMAEFADEEGFSDELDYYEYDGNNYTLTKDAARDKSKTYYVLNKERVLGYAAEGLYVKGNGEFTGTVYAKDGSFSGTVTALGGEIGGFTINSNALTSKDGKLTLQSGEKGDSKIIVDSIELGTNATIKDYIQLGTGIKLYGNATNGSNVFEIKASDAPLFSIASNGSLILGDNVSENGGYLILDGAERAIQSSNYSSGAGWRISENKSFFNNIVVRGKLETAVFETGKVSAVGGILLIRPSTKISSITTGNGASTIELEDITGFEGGGTDNPEYYYLTSTAGNSVLCKAIVGLSGKQITLTSAIGDEYLNATIVNYGKAGSIGLGINGSTSNAELPASSFSVFEWVPPSEDSGTGEKNYHIILGKLPENSLYKSLSGTYGLYADNVLLKGALIAETANAKKVYSGISTAEQTNSPKSASGYFGDNASEILIWAGAKDTDKDSIEASNFYVDRNGNLFANSGYFSGTVITKADITTSKLTAVKIFGSEDKEALVIQDDIGTLFQTSVGKPIMTVNSSGVQIHQDMNFTIEGSTFSGGKLNTSSLFISNPDETTASVRISLPDSNTTTNKGKISFSNSLNDAEDNQLSEDYAIVQDSGLKFLADGRDIFTITDADFTVSKNTYLAKDVIYGEKVRYTQVVENNQVIGYDLYI